MRVLRSVLSSACILGIVAEIAGQQPTAGVADERPMTANPLLTRSPLPFQAPPFDRICDEHYVPAIEQGMQDHLAEMTAIARDPAEPTFANTIEVMERAGELLGRASRAFFAKAQADTNPAVQQMQGDLAPKLAAHRDAIYMDAALFRRVQVVFEARNRSGLDAEQVRLVEHVHRDFVSAGAQLHEGNKLALAAINKEMSSLLTEFQRKVLAATKGGGVFVTDRARLDGLDDGAVAAASAAAKAAGKDGQWLLSLQNTTQQPVLAQLRDRGLRAEVLAASMARGAGGADDTRVIVQRLVSLRAQKADLLGYQTFADYTLADQMAGSPAKAIALLTDMVPAATNRARAEAERLRAAIASAGEDVRLTASDWSFWSERVRKQEYDLDERDIRPYFELDRVLKDGVFFAAHELYGLSFVPRPDLPVYHPDVRAFEVKDPDGSTLALFYCDYFQRDSKSGGAWMDSFVDQSTLLGTKAVVFNVCNYTKPAAGQPALLGFDDVTTMFHEFGHALHGMLSNVRYPTQSGTNVPRDFVEFPSQFNEHLVTESRVFANYARHWQTGEPMPKALVDRLHRAHTFNQGYATTEYLAAALLDMAWHSLPLQASTKDPEAFEREALQRFHVDVAEVPPRYRTSYFSHIFSGGYAAGYYAYLWSEVLDDDAWEWFVENGGMTRENGQRFRDMVLSRGGTIDPAAMFRAFRGRDPIVEPLLRERGLVTAPPAGR